MTTSTLCERLLRRGHIENPDGWKSSTLGSIASVARGRFSHRPRNDPRFFGGETPFIQTGDIVSGKGYIKRHKQTLNADGVKISKKFPSETIFMAIAANIGDCAISTYECACTDSVVGIRANKNHDQRFLSFYLNEQKNVFRYIAPEGAQKNINVEFLESLPLLLPPLPEQRKIADILSTWDHALEALDKLIKAKEKQKRGLMQQLLIGKKRLPGFEVKWRTRKLAEICRRLEEKNNGRTDRPLSMTARVGFVDQRAKWKRDIAGVSFENYVYLERGDFSYNKGNSKAYPCGCVYRLEEFDDGVVPKVFYSFRISSKEIDHEFLKQFFLAGHHNRQLTRLINSGVRNDGLLNLAAKDFFSIDVPVPPIEEQRKIASVLSTADQEISFLKQKRDAFNDQKRGLMQQLLTGNVRVKLEEDAA